VSTSVIASNRGQPASAGTLTTNPLTPEDARPYVRCFFFSAAGNSTLLRISR
jgi:hypothetical protein